MKQFLLSIFLVALTFSTAFSQVPDAFNYQAVVRNSSGEIIANKTVSFRISLLSDSESGTVLYSEKHKLSTNDFGLVNMKIGKGTKLSGEFSPDNWGDIIFTKVEIDPEGGDSFSHLATTKLLSVPYAFKAQTAVDDADTDSTNEIQILELNETELSLSNGGGSVTLPTHPWEENTQNYQSYYTMERICIGAHYASLPVQFYVNGGTTYAGVFGNSSDDPTLYVANHGDGLSALFITDIKIEGEVHTKNTGDANMVAIAYGTVNANGTLYANSNSGNISVTRVKTGEYRITITDENFQFSNYAYSATIIDTPGFISTNSVSGKLIVYTYDTSAQDKDKNFSFVVYKP